jgi:hypothetical protein
VQLGTNILDESVVFMFFSDDEGSMNIQKAYEMLKYSSSPENYLELRKLRLFS